MKTMNILFPYMARWSSAHASRYYHLLTEVANRGHKVFVIQPPSRLSGELNDIDVLLPTHANITVLTVPFYQRFWNSTFPLEKLVKKFLFTLKLYFQIKRLQSEQQIDLLYVYNLPQFIYLFGKRPRVVFDYADDLLGMLEAELSITNKHILYKIASKCLQWMLHRSDFVICISAPLFDSFQHKRKYLITNGANICNELFQHPKHLSQAPQKITVGYVGTFEYTRAIKLVIDVAKRMPDVQFLLVGSGRDFNKIREEIHQQQSSNITLTGAVSHKQAMQYVSSMDICLNLFNKIKVTHAISPLKLFEYLAHRKPIISTRLQEVERINEEFLFFADTAEEIEENIRYISSHWHEAMEKAERGYTVFKQKYMWSKISEDFLNIAKDVCN